MTESDSRRLSQGEFIALMGMMFATIAFSIDSMLPALPEIANELTPDAPNLAQLVLTSFVFGMGAGTLVTGPLSDAFGRKAVIYWGAGLYVLGSVMAYLAPSLELVLAARAIQGLGAAGPRIASMALVRDLYSGRQMARIMSFAMLVFMIFLVIVFLMHFGNETVAFDMIKAHTQIQRGEAKVIRAKKAERCLSRIDGGHKGLLTNDRNFFLGVVQHHFADPLTRTQIK